MTHTNTHKRELIAASAFVGVLAITAFVHHSMVSDGSRSSSEFAATCDGGCHSAAGKESTPAERLAIRLKNRLERSGVEASESSLVLALNERDAMAKKTVTIEVTETGTGSNTDTWTFSPAEHPGIIVFTHDWSGPRFVVDEHALTQILSTRSIEGMHTVVNPVITSVTYDGYVNRSNPVPHAQDGFAYNVKDLAAQITAALHNDEQRVALRLPYEKAHVTLKTADGEQKLTLLATGLSDYSNSPDERIWNVHKAIDERVNNVVVEKGAEFSFNATLGGPVTLDKGWKEAMGLFGGGAALTPGAGICQAATTTFRAAILAGFPITYKRNHSMFVDHYEPYGVGLDATIFPGTHDMTFVNDTASSILLQSYIVGDDVFVNVYGVDDGRSVELDGPYFATTRPRAPELRPLGHEEIGWVRHVTYADGTVKTMPSIAWYYKGFMRSVATKYAGKGMELLTTKTPQGTI